MIVRPIGIVSITEMSLANWDLTAIDFHCNNKLLEFINKKYEEIPIDEIKKLIWLNSSRIKGFLSLNFITKAHRSPSLTLWNWPKALIHK